MVGSTLNTVAYEGNGSTSTAYAIPFRYDAASWIVVTVTDAADLITVLEQGTDYTLAGDGAASTGEFTTATAYDDTNTVTVWREAPGLQTLDLTPNTPLPAASLESQMDRLAMAVTDRLTPRAVDARILAIGKPGPTGPAGPVGQIDNANLLVAIEEDPAAARTALLTDRKRIANVLDYGATGDGATDDTPAIQAAIDSGLAVYLPRPSVAYKITDVLLIKRDFTHIFGEGWGGSKIVQATANKGAFQLTADWSYNVIEGLWIVGPGPSVSTATGVDLTHVTTSTFRQTVARCIITDFHTGLKTGNTVLFKGEQLQCGSSVTDIDLTGTDTAFLDSIGTGNSYGSSAATNNLGILCHDNLGVNITNLDAGNSKQLLRTTSSRVRIVGNCNIENCTGDGAIEVGANSHLHIAGYLRVGNDVSNLPAAGSAFILIDADAGGGTATLAVGNIVGAVAAGFKDIVCRGGVRYNTWITFVGNLGSGVPIISYQSTAGGSYDSAIPASIYMPWHNTLFTGTTNNDATNLANRGRDYWRVARDDTPTVDESVGKYLRNRFNTVSRVDFNVDNHQRIIANSSAVVGNVGTGEDTLFTTTLAANTLLKVGETVTLFAYGTTAANANNKTFKVALGANTLFDSGALALNDQDWEIETVIAYYTGTSWVARTRFTYGNAVLVQTFEGTTALTAALILKLTGEATADNDIRALFTSAIWRKGSINP